MGQTRRRKKRTVNSADTEGPTIPRSFVFHRGRIGNTVMQLLTDTRKIFEPYTARHLKVRKNNVLKDFVHVAGPMGVSHFIVFSKTETSPNLRIARLPRGPTLSFQIDEFSLMSDIVALLRHPKSHGKQFSNSPLLVLNGFKNDALQMKLMTTMFQNMFPSINVQKAKVGDIRRCLLLNYNAASKTIDLRHYNIDAVPTGISRGLKKIVRSKIPNLGSLSDISEFMSGGCYLSESEGEEPADSKVVLPQKVPGRGNMKASQSAIKLTELGPRMTLKLVKIQEGLFDGEILFHEYVSKTEEEKAETKQKRQEKKKLKAMRRKEQEENLKKKEEERKKNKERSLAGMKQRKNSTDTKEESDSGKESEKEQEDEDDDVKYYRDEVGEDPEPELFAGKVGMKRKYPNKKSVRFEHIKRRKSSPKEDKNRKTIRGLSKPKSKFTFKGKKGFK